MDCWCWRRSQTGALSVRWLTRYRCCCRRQPMIAAGHCFAVAESVVLPVPEVVVAVGSGSGHCGFVPSLVRW